MPVQIIVETKGDESPESVIDTEITEFDMWLRHRVSQDPLTRYEKAILKTYLMYRRTTMKT
jgi:hypothetical protein